MPGLSGAGEAIIRGADDAMWIAEPDDPGAIARVTASGVVTEFRGGVTEQLHREQASRAAASRPGLSSAGRVVLDVLDDGDQLGRIAAAGTIGPLQRQQRPRDVAGRRP